jgi:hypothetical protein
MTLYFLQGEGRGFESLNAHHFEGPFVFGAIRLRFRTVCGPFGPVSENYS